jgi:uncharacterized linocin/CFP29 family protein
MRRRRGDSRQHHCTGSDFGDAGANLVLAPAQPSVHNRAAIRRFMGGEPDPTSSRTLQFDEERERHTMAELNWSDSQWQRVKDAVTEAFGKASVASAFLPMYGPLTGSTEIVRNVRLIQDRASTPPTIRLDSDHPDANLKLLNLTVKVELSSEHVADEKLWDAMFAFRKAANILAQEEDRIVFEGFGQNPRGADSQSVANNVDPQRGLADLPARRRFSGFDVTNSLGRAVVSAVVEAVQRLEDSFNPGPFACVLGNTLFEAVHNPSRSLALPAERITPLLKGGALLRSGTMDNSTGIVISLAGNAVDIVVGTPPTVQFLQRKEDAKFLFRVYERFVLRIKDKTTPPVAGFRIRPSAQQRTAERDRLDLVAAEREAAATAREIKDLS